MASQPTITQIRLDNIIICLNAAVATVEVVSKGLKTPFLGPIVTTMWSLLSVVQVTLGHSSFTGTDSYQTVKKNKDPCIKMLEQIHKVLYAIIQVNINSNTSGELTPKMLNNLGAFTE
jgi:hypothetical protein